MKVEIKYTSPLVYSIIVDGTMIHSSRKVHKICAYCKKHFGIEVPHKSYTIGKGAVTYFDNMPEKGFVFNTD